MLAEMKKYARYNWIPVILDDSLELLKVILKCKKPKNILEIGTAIGYSSACFSKYLEPDGKIDTIEIDNKMYLIAKANIKMLELQDKINVIKGDAIDVLPTLSKKYDIIFIDGPKSHYIEYLPLCINLLADGGIIIADNVIYKGMVTGDYNEHKQRTAVNKLREFITVVEEDTKLNSVLLNIGDGVMLISKSKDNILMEGLIK